MRKTVFPSFTLPSLFPVKALVSSPPLTRTVSRTPQNNKQKYENTPGAFLKSHLSFVGQADYDLKVLCVPVDLVFQASLSQLVSLHVVSWCSWRSQLGGAG